ncbi:ubiquitin-like-specific protease 1d [Phtheirospermum japonicum]|uniref:Ubiquitin-like-specific protease 1d n=1 Tax=Phtheirospermum japonicum TaxID=374723 RepID=A0A830D844_9LAMI|nr:ubiquitin-like-specific protease 1d [Phtheirospermum japonicum]
MEGGGERKRKAGGQLELDWDKLLGDNEPPPVVVIEAAKSKAQTPVAMMLGEGGESHKDLYLQGLSDRELADKISRAENILVNPSKLPDGGAKLRVHLKSHIAERERRKLLKADGKCKKAALLADKPIHIDATDDLASRGAPPSVPSSQSQFASRFCSKLDDKRPAKSFTNEMSTLNCCDYKRENGPFVAPRTQKIGLSSRQAPFKSPNHLSVHTNDPSQSNREHFGRHSSTPSPRQPDKGVSGYFEKKENAPRVQPMRSSKMNNRPFVLVDEEEVEVDTVNQADQVGQRSEEMKIYYPSRDDPESVEIRNSDMECLAPQSYLSSPIMNFYIRYLQKPTSPGTRKRCDYHFFNTYFYKKLKQDVLNTFEKETSFAKFRRWWKGVNIFEKAYIFLPIHESLHWSLIIICIPNKEDESGPIILHLDSLGLHNSKSIFHDVKSFLIEEWKFLRQEDVLPELPIPDNIWDKLSRRIDEKVIEV